jgi:hypothetical protein
MQEPLFDPAYAPADVLSPDGVAEVNAVVAVQLPNESDAHS